MIEIVCTTSEKYILEKSEISKAKNIVEFCVAFSYGNLKEIEERKTRNIGNQFLNITDDFNNLNLALDKDKNIRIWYCSNDSEHVCNTYYLVNYLKDLNVKINLIDTYDSQHHGLASYDIEEIPYLIKKSVELSKNEINLISGKYNHLIQEDMDLRVLDHGIIKSHSFDYIDTKILDLLKANKSIPIYKLVGMCLQNQICNYYFDAFFVDRINYLISINKIKVDKTVKEKNFINEEVIKKYISINL